MSPGFGEPITPGPSQKQSQKEPRTNDEEEDEDEDDPTGREKKGTFPTLETFRSILSVAHARE